MNKEDLILRSLQEMYLSPDEVHQTNQIVTQATFPIREAMVEVSQHQVEAVPTGSVFERYGKPLTAPGLETNLKSDYDVMFAFRKEDFPIEVAMKNDEFLHVFVVSDSCKLLNTVKSLEDSTNAFKLSAEKSRVFMKQIVQNVKIFHKESNYKVEIENKIWNGIFLPSKRGISAPARAWMAGVTF